MAGNQDEKDYADYLAYQQYLQASQKNAAPQEAQVPQSHMKLPEGSGYIPGGTPAQASLDNPEATKAFAKAGVGLATGGAAGGLAEGMGVLGNAGVNAAGGGLQQYLSNLIDKKENPSEGVMTAAGIGGAIPLAMGAAGGLLANGADRLQQRAMSNAATKYIPGVGTEAINQGIRGTRAGMQDKVAAALDRLGTKAGEQVASIPTKISSAEAAGPVQEYSKGLKVGDILPGHSASEYSGALDRGAEIAGRGEVSPQDAWGLAQKAGQSGYRNQKALQSEAATLAQLEQQGYSNAVKKAYTESHPGETELPDTFASMSKLYKAQSSLDQPETLRRGMALTNLAGAGIGTASGGPLGGVAGFLAAKAARSPVTQSYGAKGMSLFGEGADAMKSPEVLQSLFGIKNAATGQ